MNTIEKRRSWLAASPIGGSSSKDGGSNVPSVVTGLLGFLFVWLAGRSWFLFLWWFSVRPSHLLELSIWLVINRLLPFIYLSLIGPTASGRRGRFIVLGSSGECLPVNRVMAKREMFAKSLNGRTESNSVYSSCNSSDDNDNNGIEDETYFSAKTSFDDFVEGMPRDI